MVDLKVRIQFQLPQEFINIVIPIAVLKYLKDEDGEKFFILPKAKADISPIEKGKKVTFDTKPGILWTVFGSPVRLCKLFQEIDGLFLVALL